MSTEHDGPRAGESPMRVGYVGAGLMGHGAARNILERGGFPLTVVAHRNRRPVDDLLRRGAREARTLGELVAGVDVVFLCLPSSEQVREVVYAADGLLANAREGLVVVDSTTSLPDVTRQVGADLAQRGAAMVDAPLGRSPKEAEEGRLGSFVGGEEAAVERVLPIIASYSENVIRTGPLGSAMTGKIINTFISMANCAVIAEAVATAERVGLDFDVLYRIVSASGANSSMFQQVMPWVLEGDTSRLKGHLKTAYKDVSYFSRLADDVDATNFVGAAVLQLFRHAVASGHGEQFTPVLCGIAAGLNGAAIRALDTGAQ